MFCPVKLWITMPVPAWKLSSSFYICCPHHCLLETWNRGRMHQLKLLWWPYHAVWESPLGQITALRFCRCEDKQVQHMYRSEKKSPRAILNSTRPRTIQVSFFSCTHKLIILTNSDFFSKDEVSLVNRCGLLWDLRPVHFDAKKKKHNKILALPKFCKGW